MGCHSARGLIERNALTDRKGRRAGIEIERHALSAVRKSPSKDRRPQPESWDTSSSWSVPSAVHHGISLYYLTRASDPRRRGIRRSLDLEEFHLEDQRGVRPDFGAKSVLLVSQLGRNEELVLRAYGHEL